MPWPWLKPRTPKVQPSPETSSLPAYPLPPRSAAQPPSAVLTPLNLLRACIRGMQRVWENIRLRGDEPDPDSFTVHTVRT